MFYLCFWGSVIPHIWCLEAWGIVESRSVINVQLEIHHAPVSGGHGEWTSAAPKQSADVVI